MPSLLSGRYSAVKVRKKLYVTHFAAACDNVAVVHQENSGLLLARRVALGCASGDYIVTLDADDVLRYDALDGLACVIDNCAPDIIGFSFARTPDYAVAPESRLPLA